MLHIHDNLIANLDFHVTYDKHVNTCFPIVKVATKTTLMASEVGWSLSVWRPKHVYIYVCIKSGFFKCPKLMIHTFTKCMIFCNRMFPFHKAISVFGIAPQSNKGAARHNTPMFSLKKVTYVLTNVKIQYVYTINLCSRFQCKSNPLYMSYTGKNTSTSNNDSIKQTLYNNTQSP